MATTDHSKENFDLSMTANWFHVIPHIDIEFKYVNSTFDPSSNTYLEALGIIIAVPAFWLILTLSAFLIFFICRCCDKGSKNKKKLTPLKWFLCIFAILSCGALSVGLYGNVQAHKGVEKLQGAVADVQNVLFSIQSNTTAMEDGLRGSISSTLDQLEEAFQKPLSNRSMQEFLQHAVVNMRDQVALAMKSIDEIEERAKLPSFPTLPRKLHLMELIRWPATFALWCLLILFCLILIIGVARHSRCLLILFSVLGLLSVVICWLLVSFYIGICVASSDFCLDPEPFIQSLAPGAMENAVLNFYLKCGTVPDPFDDSKKESDTAVQSMETIVTSIKAVTDVFLPKDVQIQVEDLSKSVKEFGQNVTKVAALLNCQDIHKDYIEAMDGICTDGLEGMAYMLFSAVGSGFMFTVLIWLSSHTWIHIRKKNPTDQVDEEHPFLRPTSGSNPRRNRETNGRPNSREEQTFLQGRFTPPPAYEQLSGGAGRYPSYKT